MSWFFGPSQGSSSTHEGYQRSVSSPGRVAQPQATHANKGTPVSPTWDVNKDINRMFQEHTIEEMKGLEKKTRLDIDRRREDLRQMVGERYRDLIDAADSIVDMQKCSEQVKVSMEAVDGICHKLQQTHFLRGSGGARGPAVKNVSHEVTAQLKLLSNAPEEVWLCLERHCYLEAAQNFLLARHIYSQLGLGLGVAPVGSVSTAVVQKMWQSVAGFKDVILECCSQHLRSSDLEEGPVVQSLCAIILLEGCTLRQTFNHFLIARKAAVQVALSSAAHQHRSVKNQVLHLVKIILHSFLNIAAIFCQQRSPGGKNEPSLLLQQLLQFKDSPQTKPSSSSAFSSSSTSSIHSQMIPKDLLPLLPKSVSEFRPVLRASVLTEVPAGDIHSSTSDWINMCCTDVVEGVGQLLQHVSSIKALASIKSAVHSLLSTIPSPAPVDDAIKDTPHSTSEHAQWEERWTDVCSLIVNKDINIWETFFGPTLLKRVYFLLDKKLGAAGNHASSHLTELLSSMASDPSKYDDDVHCHTHLWNESAHLEAWQKGGRRAEAMIDLTLKSRACTPSIYGFCQSLGAEMESLTEDVSHYIQSSSSSVPHAPQVATSPLYPLSNPTWWHQSERPRSFPFNLYADSVDLHSYIQKATIHWITRFLQSVDVKVSKLQHLMKAAVEDGGGAEAPQLMDRLLVVGRLCSCLLDCTPPLLHLLGGTRTGASQSLKPGSRSVFDRSSGQASHHRLSHTKEVEDNIATAANLLLDKTNFIFNLWSEWTASLLVDHLRANLLSDINLPSLASTLTWSEITIKEESESGQQVSSVIHVPCHPSIYVTSLLFALGQEIGRIGGHALDRSILQHLSSAVLVGAVNAYQQLLSNQEQEHVGLSQPCALQLFFNMRFLTNILCMPEGKEEELSQQIKCVNEALQAFVDPFDLDVFMPFILSNLENQFSRLPVMFGVLLTVKGSSTVALYKPQLSGSGGNKKGQQDRPIPLPLAPGMGRIPSLPISSKAADSGLHHKITRLQEPNLPSSSASSVLQTISFFHHL